MPILRRTAAVTATALICATAFACAPAKPDTTSAKSSDSASSVVARTNAIRDSVQALLTEFTDKMSNGDLKGAGELYSNDSSFYWIENGSLRFQKVSELRESLLTLKSIPQIKLTYYETRIDVLSPTIANVRTEFSQTFLNGVGKGDTYGGYMTLTVVREADGWRMRSGHTSSRRPRPGF